jgi:hypothetical protein
MYGWLWRHLPGETPQRLAIAAGAMIVAAALLWYFVFPWVEPKLQFDHGTVGGGASAPASPGP